MDIDDTYDWAANAYGCWLLAIGEMRMKFEAKIRREILFQVRQHEDVRRGVFPWCGADFTEAKAQAELETIGSRLAALKAALYPSEV